MYVFKEDVIDIQERGNSWDEMGVENPLFFWHERKKDYEIYMRRGMRLSACQLVSASWVR